ncbi:MAG: PEP-CTERM sorting domain-containing protein [Planctomycetes bacterium]|nr:PEP-CTERM sorting domain-containing protein [Planctomycetota bacterium]
MIIKPSDPAQNGMWTTVPEPATMSLLALGSLAVLHRRRRRS